MMMRLLKQTNCSNRLCRSIQPVRNLWMPLNLDIRRHEPPQTHPHSPHLPSALSLSSNALIDHGKGCFVYSTDGKEYLDFQSGIGVTSLGHCHPRVVEAVTKQANKLIHGQITCFTHTGLVELAKRLTTLSPGGGKLDQIHFANSGAESIENAVKLARAVTGKQNIITFGGGFHGRTIAASALTTAKNMYKVGSNPSIPGVFSVPYPYCHHCPIACSNQKYNRDSCCMQVIKDIRNLIKQQTAASDTAAILVEPILGEGGYVVPPSNFLKELRKFADENNIMLIADEVQTGFGRTGKMWAIEHFDIIPDILVIAKGIASGFPLSAILSSSSIMSKVGKGGMGGTFGGNAVSCAASLAVLDTFTEEKILDNVVARGQQLMEGLKKIQALNPTIISDVRGMGLMVGVEFNMDNPNVVPGTASKMVGACGENGLLLLTAGIYESIRFVPPLIVNVKEIDKGLQLFHASLKQVFPSAL